MKGFNYRVTVPKSDITRIVYLRFFRLVELEKIIDISHIFLPFVLFIPICPSKSSRTIFPIFLFKSKIIQAIVSTRKIFIFFRYNNYRFDNIPPDVGHEIYKKKMKIPRNKIQTSLYTSITLNIYQGFS